MLVFVAQPPILILLPLQRRLVVPLSHTKDSRLPRRSSRVAILFTCYIAIKKIRKIRLLEKSLLMMTVII